MESFFQWLNPEYIVQVGGIALVAAIIFIESGIFFGFFLPGDSLLFTAGLLCGTRYIHLSIEWVIIILMTAAFLGYLVGYYTGSWFVRSRIYFNEKYLFKRKYFSRSAAFFRLHKGLAFILARFIPLIRTFLPILAGSISLNFRSFLLYNFLGSLIWVNLIVLSGYFLRLFNPGLLYKLEWVVVGLIIITTIPVIRIIFGKKVIRRKRGLSIARKG